MPETIRAAVADSDFKLQGTELEDGSVELLVMDEIGENWFGEGITAKDVIGFLNDHSGKPVNVRINSFGGSAYDGIVIHNALSNHNAEVTTTIEGIAFSAASHIFLSGSKRRMHEASDFGIHRASVGAVGNLNVFLAMAEWLKTLDQHQIDVYMAATGKSEQQVTEWLEGTDGMMGTIFPAAQAVEHGFATEMISLRKKNKDYQETAVKEKITASVGQRIAALRRSMHRV
jgi:ATP-dependent protease ClpP protease subunit